MQSCKIALNGDAQEKICGFPLFIVNIKIGHIISENTFMMCPTFCFAVVSFMLNSIIFRIVKRSMLCYNVCITYFKGEILWQPY